jgi:hypothetical protein
MKKFILLTGICAGLLFAGTKTSSALNVIVGESTLIFPDDMTLNQIKENLSRELNIGSDARFEADGMLCGVRAGSLTGEELLVLGITEVKCKTRPFSPIMDLAIVCFAFGKPRIFEVCLTDSATVYDAMNVFLRLAPQQFSKLPQLDRTNLEAVIYDATGEIAQKANGSTPIKELDVCRGGKNMLGLWRR